jgi:hypothetical protein
MLGVLLAQPGPLARLMVAVGRLSVAIPCTSPTTPIISSAGNGCSCVKKYKMASVSANQLHVADSSTHGLGPGRGGPPRSCPGPPGAAPIPITPIDRVRSPSPKPTTVSFLAKTIVLSQHIEAKWTPVPLFHYLRTYLWSPVHAVRAVSVLCPCCPCCPCYPCYPCYPC